MAFTTIPGSGAAATTIVGTDGVDLGSITSIDNYFVGAQQDADTIGVTANLSNGTIKGGQGTDTLSFTGGASITSSFVNLNSNNDSVAPAAAGQAANFFTSTVLGGQGNDQFTIGTASGGTVNGNKDNDSIISATTATATLYGGQGNDTVNSTASATSLVSGDLGNDQVIIGAGNQTSSTFNGGDGTDRITLSAAAAAANTFTSNTINGGAGADTITDAAGGRTQTGTIVNGDGGIDTINMARIAAAITINGGEDGDILVSGLASDVVTGGAGNDVITNTGGAAGAAIGDTITGGTGADAITSAVNDTSERVVQGVGDGVAATGGVTNLTNAGLLATNSTFTFTNGVDTITGAGFGGALDQMATGIAGCVAAGVNNGIQNTAGGNANNTLNWAALAAGNYLVQGTYTAGNQTFTCAAAGPDTMFIQSTGGDATNASVIGTSTVIITGGIATGFNTSDIIV